MFNTQAHPGLRKFVVLLMAFIIVLTYMPAEAFANTNDWRPGSKVYFKNGDILHDVNGKTYSSSYSNTPRHSYALKPVSGGKMVRGYCLQRMIMNPSNGSTKYTAEKPDAFMKSLGDKKAEAIKLALLYGKQADSSLTDMEEMLGVSRSDVNLDDWWLATQMIIWDYEQELRTSVDSIPKNVSGSNLGTRPSGGESADFNWSKIKGRGAGKAYLAMLKKMRDHKPIPQFTSKSEKSPSIIYMDEGVEGSGEWKAVNPKYSKNMKDEEREAARANDDYYLLLDKYDVKQALKVLKGEKLDKRFTFKKVQKAVYEGDKLVKSARWTLVFKDAKLPADTQHGKKDVKEATKDDLLVWKASGYQTVATGADDPVDFYFKMKPVGTTPPPPPDKPECPYNPKPDIEVFPEFSFPVHKDDKNTGWDYPGNGDVCTGMGDAPLDSTFTLYRADKPGKDGSWGDYEAVDEIQLDVYGNTDYLTDMPWLSSEDIPSEDSGFREHYAGDPAKLHCTVTPTKCEWDAEVKYKVVETGIPEGRFDESDSGTGNGVRETYTVTYHAEAENNQKCTDCPENWGPITYTITVTDATGTVTVYEGTVEDGDIEVEFTHEFEEQIFVNDNFRGDLQIVKSKDDEDPFTDKTNNDNGVKDPSTKSLWTIELESGGWEGCPYVRVKDKGVDKDQYGKYTHTYLATRDNSGTPAGPLNDPDHPEYKPLEVSQDGQIYIQDLPYGTYIVKEWKADSDTYVKEEFRVVIDKDGDKESFIVNNQAKKNKIKVVKTNAETGKTVRWDADRTAFRIKYLGNPNVSGEQPNAGRYLPNGSSYTDQEQDFIFYANKNGEIVLPYQIEYGNYEIEELVVPEGYFVGKYNQDGKGSIADMGEVDIRDHKGQTVTPPKSFLENVFVRDKDGNRIENFTGNVETTYNTYKFNIREQDNHMNGTDYITYHAIVEMPNLPAKGKIEITKDGEALAGWNENKDSNYSIWKAIWDKIRQKDTKYEIYAAEDIMQSDGVIPVKAYDTETNEEVKLDKVSRDHADIDGAKEVWEKIFGENERIDRVSLKEALSQMNKTVTEYILKALNGATYTEEFKVRDDDAKMTYYYTVQYKLNYSKGGFNYTDVHATKKSVSDDYVAEIKPITDPVLKNGEEEVGITTMNYENGNMVRTNRLDSEKDDEFTGVHSEYNTDDITATIVDPKEYEPKQAVDENGEPLFEMNEETGEPKLDENGEKIPVMTEPLKIVKPAGWTDYTKNAEGDEITNAFMVTKDGEYQILVQDGNQRRWIPCTEDQKFYLSYFQEYDFTTAQHFDCEDGFHFNWDDVMDMTSDVDHEKEQSTTVITGYPGVAPEITETNIYTHETVENEIGNHITTFIGDPADKAPHYFKTHDGIRTEMYLSGKLTHTRVTLTQSQLFKFDVTYPMVQFFWEGEYRTIDWSKDMKPKNNHFEEIYNDTNYVKADRHEVSPNNKEVYYTIDIVSDNTDPTKGYRVIYPDTTTCVPVVTDNGLGGKLVWESIDDTMVYPIGKPVEIITTNLKGIAESSELPLGTYWVREVKSNEGHVNKGEWRKVTLEYKDQYTPLIWDTAHYDNEAVSVKIDLDKVFETAYESKEYKPGSGAIFGIFTAEEIKAVTETDKKVDVKNLPADSLVETLKVVDGHAASTVKLPLGKYYIKEIVAPDGYKLNGTKYYFDAVDVLTAADMKFHYKDMGISGFLTQDGENGVTVDFDTLYKYKATKVNIDGKEYSMDTNYAEEGSNVSVAVMDGRTNTQIKLNDGQQTIIKFEDGASIVVKAEGQTYTATLDGPAPTKLETGDEGNENFTKSTEGTKTIIKYSPKVTKTNWLSEAEYKYVAPKGDKPETDDGWVTIQPANKELKLTSPEGTSAVNASVDYEYGTAELTFPTGTVTGITIDGEVAEVTDTLTLQRIVRTPADEENNTPAKEEIKETNAVINFDDGVTFTVQMDKAGQVYMTAAGMVEKNLETESVLTVDGKTDLPKGINLKNTTAKTYARNNTSAGVLNIVVKAIKNDRLPGEVPPEPEKPTPPGPGPSPDRPSIKTTAIDSDTRDHIANADGKVTIIDTVEYRNLTPGKEYLMKGTLMDKATGKPILINGKPVTAEKKFTPEKPNGSVDIEFTFDASKLDGKTTVVFEEIYQMKDTDKDGKPDTPEDKPTTDHKDINDEGQTIYFPEIKTTAKDSDTENHISNADGKVTIVDTVAYKNLIPGKEYTMSGVLMDKATGKPLLVNGKKVTATKTFTPEKPNGTVELEFTFDGSALAGKTLVVFESCKLDGKEVGTHEDITDKEQTVYIPSVKTTAASTEKGVITDKVAYKNLIPGVEYTVKGVLMDKATGKPVLTSDGKKITAEKTFTPKTPNGTVELEFHFNPKDVAGKTTVVFEKLYLDDELVGSHEDINDKNQTVVFDKYGTVDIETPNNNGNDENGNVEVGPQTGDTTNMIPYILVAVLAFVALSLLIAKRRREEQEK